MVGWRQIFVAGLSREIAPFHVPGAAGMHDIFRRGLPSIGSNFPSTSRFPILNAALDEAERNIQSPRPLIVFGALTALSVAIQGRFDVRKPIGQCVPLSLLLLAAAYSGERKTSSENVFVDPVREFQKEQEVGWRKRLAEWEVRTKIWDIENKQLLRKFEKSASKGFSTRFFEAQLMQHASLRPQRPRQFKLFYDDSTTEALYFGGYQNIPSVGVISSEGGLKGRVFSDIPKINMTWSNDPIVIDRKTAESFELHNFRMTVSFMTQPSAFKSYIEKNGESARGSGLWARFLVCAPESTQGSRVLENSTLSWEHVKVYKDRLRVLLASNLILVDSPNEPREVVQFSTDAHDRWLEVFNEIELNIKAGGRFCEAGDHASKLMDNISRVAGILHIFEGYSGDISLGVLNFAIDFCLWCSDEFYKLFVPPREVDLDVHELRDWFDKYYSDGYLEVKKNHILQCGPRKFRNKKRLDRALEELYSLGEISYSEQGSTLLVNFSMIKVPRQRSALKIEF
ncbi:YfjI family protein [Pseudomonas guineae]|uniref:YfjI family protein n=1 Tax=Pseudomonas guineae TaxID=425504 RepID=UPI003CFF320F